MSGYDLGDDFKCYPWTCETGEGCKACFVQSLRTAHQQCAICNPGFYRDDLTCKPFNCTVGGSELCAMCTEQADRTAHQQCVACNPGFRLTDEATCRPWGCISGEGQACAECKGQEERTKDNDCATCNPGYFLTPFGCKAWECNVGINGQL